MTRMILSFEYCTKRAGKLRGMETLPSLKPKTADTVRSSASAMDMTATSPSGRSSNSSNPLLGDPPRGQNPLATESTEDHRVTNLILVQSAAMRAMKQILLAAALLFSAICAAEPISQLHPSNYVNDFAHVLSDQTVAELNNTCQQIAQKPPPQFTFIPTNPPAASHVERY